jgi:hemerythrin-like metal-binding protein
MMALLEWAQEDAMGIPSIDDQHKTMITMINELFDGMQEQKEKEVLESALQMLLLFTADHFQYEEMLFEQTNYPLAQEHRDEHEKLKKQVLEVRKCFDSSLTGLISVEVSSFLRNWLLEHIRTSDKKFVPHLIANGVT